MATEGLSKKELNKLARKAGRSAAPAEVAVNKEPSTQLITFCQEAVPLLARSVDLLLRINNSVDYTIKKGGNAFLPILTNSFLQNSSISGDANISRYLIRSAGDKAPASIYGGGNAWLASQIDQWLDVYTFATSLDTLCSVLETHLDDKTYLVGHCFTVADMAINVGLGKLGFKKSAAHPNTSRWLELTSEDMPKPTVPAIPLTFAPVAAVVTTKDKTAKVAGGDTSKSKAANDAEGGRDDTAGSCPPLENAVDGQVVTRFPPEPSGYLHIGHAKAVLLNQYYAQRYNGKMLVRFDDTNPSKEKEEFEENIIADLKTMGVVAHKVSHSSDHFATCEKYAKMLITNGQAYMDCTEQETMQAERMEKKESKYRNTLPKENLELFDKLLAGDPAATSYCLRAKIDMSSVNGTMRDPVIYRYNATPHHRTGTKHKAYPTYDMACPIIDSVEGVTHALRTTEYNDRKEQYEWFQKAMKLRPVYITEFGKMNFVHTVLSKRRLTWFVDNNLVDGWFDPRFPTVQGCVRRGMNVDTLKTFMINQGASRRVVNMEWDKFWAENKKVLEDTSPRYMGVDENNAVHVELTNVSNIVSAHDVPIHPSKPEMGTRVMRRLNDVIIDQADAKTLSDGEEFTLLRWGNVTITSITSVDDVVTHIKATYDPTSTNFSKTKKITWLAYVPADLVQCKLFQFDHIITKATLAADDDFKDYVNTDSKKELSALCDPYLRTVPAGTFVQLERKGFFRVDSAYGGPGKPPVLFLVPDGKGKPSAAVQASSKKK